MAICRISAPAGQSEFALYRDGQVCLLSQLLDEVPDAAELFSLPMSWWDGLPDPTPDQWVSAGDNLLPPVDSPGKVICIGLNYRDHAIETGAAIPDEPVVFSKFPSTIIGHGDSIELPSVSREVDYEAELVVVIGKSGKLIPAERAMEHVFGYTCGHDVSARDWQKGRPGGQWLLGKTFDTFAPIGPCIVTQTEVPDPNDLRVQMVLNGEIVQDSTTAQLIFDIPAIIEHVSKVVTLSPGDLIFTGTPPGVGAARNPPLFLKPGDVCSVIVQGIGTLTNRCV
ncbi:fumarylacetoacetate hydrolase family protein [Stieleria varia]|uniref:Ureidoglycolate lyase n=1 Tax=Stieleria varia TaxID=2528005 RepID=A0A5C6B7M6_9BACT|nr:fumarylacetoacetate hydrolase family protein [Stieleria varia]TWU07950.1 Ureidoglycolate lyase [Stieleria varia]